MISEVSDTDLVALYQSASEAAEEAYNEIVNRYYYTLLRACRGYLFNLQNTRLMYEGIDSLARDITHDFMVEQLPRVLRKYNVSRGSLRTWLHRCIINYSTDVLRRRPKGIIQSFHVEEEEWKSHDIVVEVLGEHSPHQERDFQEVQRVVLTHLERLPEHYRRPLELRFWQGLSVEEIAKELRLPLGTVKSQLSRAITILRQRLQAEGWDTELR
ncbi:MAG: sigma-70 family RNA polymerase sigma factor [Bacteroidia bacterium]|nr:sigma-70 family RNA polymerase sigma factor [Bacteroidia bacterium]MCX7764219.1 sigma-70 family RNA polymerase sigma factor [Bacteroidia bacterium]MDW8056896.1 sigma-70 family RNA polymerase sigma factor [Bacteroidia bacterium]